MRRETVNHIAWISLLRCVSLLAGAAIGAWWILRRSMRMLPPNRREAALRRLLRAVVGNDKSAVARVFGPPHASAGFASLAPANLVWNDALRSADTWYYPLDRSARMALAVRFQGNVASEVQVVSIPKAVTSSID